MNTVKVRNLELGNGIPAICIPNVGKTKEDILSLTRTYLGMHMDLMEWRMDWYEVLPCCRFPFCKKLQK